MQEPGTRYLQLADKAQRTVVMLTERLDHHPGRSSQDGARPRAEVISFGHSNISN
jgi:hypothetical protein